VKFVEKSWKFSKDKRTGKGITKKITEAGSKARALNRLDLTVNERKKPATPPYSAGDSIHKNIGPGMANACSKV